MIQRSAVWVHTELVWKRPRYKHFTVSGDNSLILPVLTRELVDMCYFKTSITRGKKSIIKNSHIVLI